jgi:hypothetical protein
MTGLIDRVRAWVGSLLGGGVDDADATAETPATTTDPTVVHRDDRPLETPGTMSPADARPPAAGSVGGDDRGRAADPTTSADEPTTTGATAGDAPGDGPVSIPDAEAVAEKTAGSAATDAGQRSADADETPGPATDAGAASNRTADSDRETAAERGDGDAVTAVENAAAEAFVCSVCGTAVDDPAADCPLCRSTDVVPVGAGETDDGTTRSGRTTVSSTAEEDDAVDRLRDVRDEGGRAD